MHKQRVKGCGTSGVGLSNFFPKSCVWGQQEREGACGSFGSLARLTFFRGCVRGQKRGNGRARRPREKGGPTILLELRVGQQGKRGRTWAPEGGGAPRSRGCAERIHRWFWRWGYRRGGRCTPQCAGTRPANSGAAIIARPPRQAPSGRRWLCPTSRCRGPGRR